MHLALYLLHVASCQYIPHEQIQQTERKGSLQVHACQVAIPVVTIKEHGTLLQ